MMSSGLYSLDESTKELLSIASFERDFSTGYFIEQLSQNHAGTGTLSEVLDPKPYIRTFEAALAELHQLRTATEREEKALLADMKKSEMKHINNVSELGSTIDTIMTEFGVLDGLVGDIGAATSILSDKLERLSLQHEMASSSGFLIECYLKFKSYGACRELEVLWDGPPLAKRKCANVVRQLRILSARLQGLDQNGRAEVEIDKFAERLENNTLELFNDAYAKADMAVMRESADILTDFNGGGSVIQTFVNQHDFFIEVNRMVSAVDDNGKLWDELSEVHASNFEYEKILQEVVDDILNVMHTETEIICKVFREPLTVLKVFLQRIFAQRIEGRLENHLVAAENASNLAYVRALHMAYGKMSGLVTSLKEFLASASIDIDGELSTLLDQNFADAFVIYIENGKYFEKEMKCLSENIQFLTSRHTEQKGPKDGTILSRFVSPEEKPKSDRMNQLMGLIRPESKPQGVRRSVNSQDIVETSFHLDIDFEIVQACLKLAAEAVNRDLELSSPADIAENAESILQIILERVGREYICTALDDAARRATDMKQEGLTHLNVIAKAVGTIQLLATFVKTVLLSMVNGSGQWQRAMIAKLNVFVDDTDRKINSIMHITVDLIMNRISTTLALQKKKDFLPRDDIPRPVKTDVSATITALLDTVVSTAQEAIEGKNYHTFLLEVGLGFRDLLLDHLKKYTVSMSGASVLMGDLQQYQELIDNWSIPGLSESFAILHTIGNLFAAQPTAIPLLLRQTNLSLLRPPLIREYLSKRVDYYSSSINKLVSSNHITQVTSATLEDYKKYSVYSSTLI